MTRQRCWHLCARLRQDTGRAAPTLTPHTADPQQPLQLETFGFPVWTEPDGGYQMGYWSIISLSHTQISTGKYSVMSLGGRGRALPEALTGPWGLSSSLSHQEGFFSEYRAPQICAWCVPLTCQCFQAFPSTWKQSGSGWSFFHFSVEKYSQKERSMSAHHQENERS